MTKLVALIAALLVVASAAPAAASPQFGIKVAGRVVTLTGTGFPVKSCPKAVVLKWKHAGNSVIVSHSLGTAKLVRPHGTFTFVWHVPPSVHGPLYVVVDDNCTVKGLQQSYETYTSFTAP